MGTCPDSIKRLIERFSMQAAQMFSPDYNETQLRIDFVNPMFAALGWDMDNAQGFAEQYREVVHEDRVRVAGATKAPDYSFRIGGVRKFFLETKRPAVNIKENWEPAYQLRRYGWSAKLAVSLLTDFEELAVYDCRVIPRQLEKASTARREYIRYEDYPARWDFIEGTFSKRAVLQGDFDRYCQTNKGRGAQEFDEAFLGEIEEWRKKLAGNLALRNQSLDERQLNFAVQRIIDRIIFLRICEDRGIEHAGQLQALLNADRVYSRLFQLFSHADTRYNSGLFHFKAEPGREEGPDELTPALEVDDAALKSILGRLYYPESPYEFSVVSADILGSVYERFLGKVISLTAGHRAKVEEKPEVRKAGGVYYTPSYIVEYIVKETVGRLLEGKTLKEASRLKILDPACGSGSFLLGAYQCLLDWHVAWYQADGPEKWSKGKQAALRPGPAGDWRLTIRERKRILLDNIFGVDIDYQAVEVTKLSLLLRVLEGETAESLGGLWALFRERALPDLGRNIQCGNSLIGTDIMGTEAWTAMTEEAREKVNPFDFDSGFSAIFSRGRFSAVIGNPPYGALATAEEASYYREHYTTLANSLDTFILFVERSASLLSNGGKLGVIIPSGWVSTPSSRSLREFFLKSFQPESFVSLPFDVFASAYVDTSIVIARRRSSDLPLDPRIRLVVFPHRHRISTAAEFEAFEKRGDAGDWAVDPDRQFLVTSSAGEVSLLRRIQGQSSTIGDVVAVKRGIETYLPRAKAEGLVNPVRAFEGVLQRYSLIRGPTRFIDYSESIQQSKPWEFFSGPRILLRQVLSRRLRLQAAFTNEPFVTNQSVQSLVHVGESNSVPSLRFILGCLNSRLLSWYFVKMNSAARRDDFPKIIIKQTRKLPLPPSALSSRSGQRQHRLIESMVDAMGSLCDRAASSRLPQAKEQLRREIEVTDRRIDRLVYQLYGLSPEEIEIVESSTN